MSSKKKLLTPEQQERQKDMQEIGRIFRQMDSLFREGKWDTAGKIIAELDLASLTTTVIVGWMTAVCWTKPTNQAAKMLMGFPEECPLPGRDEFMKRCADEVRRRDPQGADRILIGLV